MSSAPSLAPTLPLGQAAEHLQVRLRPDLVVQPQFYEGMTHYVIKDPLALKYFRFKIEEYFLLQQFDGKQQLQDVKKAFERKYRPQTISIEDLTRFVAQLHEAGIIVIDSGEQAKVLIRRRKKNKWRKVWSFLANILFIKIPIIDPERLLTRMYPYFRWIFSSAFIGVSVTSMLLALTLVLSNWKTFYDKLPDFQSFFNWWTIMSFWGSLAIVKIIHEFGHGLTAKHFGGEVHEMGILFLVLTPALYCDVTDSWLLPNKWKRIWISAAGIYVECFLASLATFVWWYSQPGLLNSLAMATMFICSVNTIMFNANPLLRYDGYYVMADWLEIPNLRIKSTQFFAYLVQEKVLGLEIPVQSYLPKSRRYLFVTYAVASYIYRWFVTFAILWFLSQVLKPHKLESVSYLLAVGAMVPLVGTPVYQIGKFLRTPGRLRKVKKVTCDRVRRGGDRAGHGDPVHPDAVASPGDVRAPAGQARGGVFRGRGPAGGDQRQERPVGHQGHRAGQAVQPPEAEGTAGEAARPRRQLPQVPVVQPQPRAGEPGAGHAVQGDGRQGRADHQEHHRPDRQADAGGQPRRPGDRGAASLERRPVAQAGQAGGCRHARRAAVPEPRRQAVLLRDRRPQEARGAPDPRPGRHQPAERGEPGLAEGRRQGRDDLPSKVSEIAPRTSDQVPTELSNLAEGEIASKPDPKTGAAKPMNAVYEIIIPVDNADLELEPGLRGFAKIDCGNYTLAWWLLRWWNKVFNFQL